MLLSDIPTYVISLKHATARRERLARRLAAYPLGPVVWWDASTPADVPTAPWEFNPGLSETSKACALSHMRLWLNCLATHHDIVLILEDDTVFHPTWHQRMLERIADPTPWHALFLNVNEECYPLNTWRPAHAQQFLGATLYKRSALLWLVDAYAKQLELADWMTCVLQNTLPCETYFPWLAIQENADTYIKDRGTQPEAEHVRRCLADAGHSVDEYDWTPPPYQRALHCFSVVSDATKTFYLSSTTEALGLKVLLAPWKGYVTKVEEVEKAIATLPDDAIVCVVDGYDVVAAFPTPAQVLAAYDTIRGTKELVMSTELNCFPAQYRNEYPPDCTAFINSGGYVGTVRAVKQMLGWQPPHARSTTCAYWPGGDQAYLMEYCLAYPERVALDERSHLFQSMFGVPPDVLEVQHGRVRNAFTGATPLFIHFNGKGCIDWMLRLHTALFKSLSTPRLFLLPPAPPGKHVLLPPYAKATPQHLRALAATDLLPPAHQAMLYHLRDHYSFQPTTIYDIGACVLHWTSHAERVWPDAEVVLFEAFLDVEGLYGLHKRYMGVLADTERDVTWYENSTYPGGNSYYRETATDLFPATAGVPRRAHPLDAVVRSLSLPPPQLMKIDVQGAELDVLRGATETLKTVEWLIVELQHERYNDGASLASASVPFIESLGFECVHARFSATPFDADYLFRRRT